MTFEEFKASRKHCDDLPAFVDSQNWNSPGDPPKGFAYAEGGFIEFTSSSTSSAPQYYLILGRYDWTATTAAELERLEKKLFLWIIDENGIETTDSPAFLAQLRWEAADKPSPAHLGNRFAAILRDLLPQKTFEMMQARNRDERDPKICHSQDFCDANMAMSDAWRWFHLPAVNGDDEEQCTLWNAAWAHAKALHLTAK